MRSDAIAESGWWSDKTIAEIIHEYGKVRGDLCEQYARDQLTAIIEQRIANPTTLADQWDQRADRMEYGLSLSAFNQGYAAALRDCARAVRGQG